MEKITQFLVLLIVLVPNLATSQVHTDAQNQDIINLNRFTINDPGVGEGFLFNNTAASWVIDVSPENRSNNDGNLNLYGTSGLIVNWRPLKLKGAQSNLIVEGTGSSYISGSLGIGIGSATALDAKLVVSSPNATIGGKWNPGQAYLKLTGAGTSLIMDSNEIYSDGNLHFGTSYVGDIIFRNVNSSGFEDLMTIKYTGNVGVGNTNPTAKVHVSDTESLGGVWNPALSYLTIAGFGSSLIMDSNEIYSDNSLNFGSSYTHDITFRNVDTEGNQDLMIIKSTGDVGIGTSSPNSRLAVNGKITAREVEVTADGWADFVFEEDYALPALADIETHIKEKKHLPGIPSAAEVEENGINLGAMDALLLQKIEELTLYMIQQEKINQKQSVLLKKMQEENKQLYEKISVLEATSQ